MDLNLWPNAVLFDPERSLSPGVFDPVVDALEGKGAAVLLVVGPEADSSGWAAKAAVALADAWAARGRHVLLADVAMDAPTLHASVAADNDEGIADVLLFGASVERVARPIAGHHFSFIPAGAFIADPAALLQDLSWDRLIAECVTREERLLCFIPAGTTGLAALAEKIEPAVFLGDREDAETASLLLPEPIHILTAVVPEGAGEEAAAGGAPEPPSTEAREALIAELRARQQAALRESGRAASIGHPEAPEPAPPVAVPGDPRVPDGGSGRSPTVAPRMEPPAAPPGPERPPAQQPSRDRRPVFWLVLLAAALVVAILAVWHFINARLDDQAAVIAPPAQQVAPPVPAGMPLPFSVAVEAHRRLASAEGRLDTLRERAPGVLFYIAPIRMDSVLYYRLMAGPAADSAAASALQDRLVAQGVKRAASAWDVRYTPLAFLLKDFQTREAALQISMDLRRRGVPSYVLEVPDTVGVRYRLYAGAYAEEAEAAVLGQLLRQAGLDDSLVQRIGRSSS